MSDVDTEPNDVTPDEDVDLDPFDFTDKSEQVYSTDIDWNKAYDWAPRLVSLPAPEDDKRKFRGRMSDIAQAILYHLGKPLRLDNHAFMLPVYNDGLKRLVLKCSRQVAKTVQLDTRISLANGATKPARDIQAGDIVATMNTDGRTMSTSRVTWVSDVFHKPCVRILTRQGHSIDAAITHPVRVWEDWKKAGLIEAGERLAVVRRCGEFAEHADVAPERIRLTAYLVGDGYIAKDISFTTVPGATLDEFLSDLQAVGGSASISTKSESKAVSVRVRRQGPLHGWMDEDGLRGSRSATKFIPPWVFSLTRKDTALFLNRLWSTDGHVKIRRSRYAIGYASISHELVLGVQQLLWKFGIPSKIRSWIPGAYRGTEKRAYSLRIETQDGAGCFLSKIGCLGKSELVVQHEALSNNNQDTYPIEIQQLISAVVDSRGDDCRLGRFAEHSLRSAGLMEKLKYPPTRARVCAYLDHFRGDDRYDQRCVDKLASVLNTDLFWDRVVAVDDIGHQECIDFEVEDTHCYVANGFVAHNSTTICNIQVTESAINPHWRSLYVSPSALQTRQYSNEKMRPTVYDSPFIRDLFIDKYVIDQVFEKTLRNGAYMFLRYAFLTAARARGIPASRVFFDEVQDLLKDNIKVISQSLAASRLAAKVAGAELLAGTPLTFSNTLEEYWKWSTQNEWLVPCDCKSPRYWNFLTETNIGREALICDNCGKPLNAAAGQWVTFEPNEMYVGYHISQLMVPWKQSPEAWSTEIFHPYEKWPESKFQNEILGFSFDSASAPISRIDLQRNCYPAQQVQGRDTSKFTCSRTPAHRNLRIFAGVDWGEGREEGEIKGGKKHFASWTVLTLGAYIKSDLFWIFYQKRYVGKDVDPELILPDLLQICGYFNVEVVGADWGHGWGMNSRIMKARGREGIMQFAYSASLRERKRWDGQAFKYVINRNAALSQFFECIKKASLCLPRWEEFEPFAKDFLAEYVEYNERTRTMQYDHPIDQPDDALHSAIYCKLAADISYGRF